MLSNVNIFAVIAAAFLHMGIGYAWYSSRCFGKTWMKGMGIKTDTEEDKAKLQSMQKGMGMTYALSFVIALIMAYVLADILSFTRMRTVAEGMELAALLWFGFLAAPTFMNALYTRKSKSLWAIDAGYPLVSLLVMSILFILWR